MQRKSADPDIVYFSKHRVDLFVACLITFTILILLVIPIFALSRLTIAGKANVIITISVLLVFALVVGCWVNRYYENVVGC